MFVRTIGMGIGVLLAMTAHQAFAIEPARHTAEWYRTHPQERESVLRTCQNDHTYDDSADCRNALSGAHSSLADSLATAGTQDREADPAYYGHDAGMIAITLSMCASGGVPPSWCAAARTASENLKR
jgi:hypothetical protein